MDNLSDDIIKYKKGELSPAQMHALEKRALSDPFLADALEGIDQLSTSDVEADVAAIQEKISRKKTILFTPMRIAAGIILLAASAWIVYQFAPSEEKIAMVKEVPKTIDKVDSVKPNDAPIPSSASPTPKG